MLLLRTILLFMFLGSDASFAAEDSLLERAKSQLDNLRQLIKPGGGSDEGSVVAQLRDSERRYGDAVRLLGELKTQMTLQSESLRMLRQKKQHLSVKALAQDRELIAQARATYRLGEHEQLKLLLGQQDFSLSGRMLGYYASLTQARIREVQKLKAAIAKAEELETTIAADAGKLEKTQLQFQKEIEHLQQVKLERQALVARMRNNEPKERGAEQLATDKRLQSVLGELKPNAATTAPSSGEGAGWPVQGRILATFGAQRDGGRWDGVLIGAPEGSPVRAVSGGQVVYSDWLRGYGLLSIVDHGNGYMSLYAFNQTLYKGVGERVAKGDILALVGNSGGNESPGLYFGLRQNGRPVDPLLWCAQN